ncbi:fused MFS/spermidine synthase, partial [bacterium]|nr:fused MFS/spermidine synthase [candidate division CSSED10-310 bacterium]
MKLDAPNSRLLLILYPAFFLSGACGLIYEVVWVRMFTALFGSTTYAVSTVLAAFMAGLALGSYLYGRFVDGRRRILPVYAGLEVGIALTGAALPFIMHVLQPAMHALYRELHHDRPLLTIAQFLIGFLLMVIPTTLMGATLPVLSRYLVRQRRQVTRRTGLLYALNTLGAVAGTLAAGFVLIRSVGLTASILAAAAVNLGIGLTVLWCSAKEHASGPVHATGSDVKIVDEPVPARMKLLLFLFACSGFTALCYEVVWTRTLSMVMGSSTYAFSIMLAAFLTGIALGGLVISRLGIDPSRGLHWFGVVEILIGVAGSVGFMLYSNLPATFLRLFAGLGYGERWQGIMVGHMALSMLVLLPLTLLYGATFPLVAGYIAYRPNRVGASVGAAYSVNTVGSIVGSLAGGFLLLPLLGTQRALLVLAAGNLVIGAMALLRRTPWLPPLLGLLALVPLMLVPLPPPKLL